MAKPTASSRFQLSLGSRIFLATSLIVTLAIAAAVAVTYLLGNRIADRAARDTLERSSWVQSSFKDTRIEMLRMATYQVAGEPAFFAYVAAAVQEGDTASLRDLLEERRNDLGLALAIVLDPDGFVLAQAGDILTLEEDFSSETVYLQALEEYDAAGIWVRNDRLFYVTAVPIGAGGLLQGFLVTAEAIDDSRADDLRRINGTEVTFVLTPADGEPSWGATTLDADMADDLTAAVAARPELFASEAETAEEQGHFEIELRRQQYLALARPLEDVAGQPLGAVVNLASLEEQLAPYRRIGRIFAAVGLVAILLSLPISYFLPRRVLQPISELSEAAAAAAEGDYDRQIEATSTDEVGRLATSFSTLLSELREKRDMEIYVSELTRSLPDQESAAGTDAIPAEEKEVALLGVELRDYTRDSTGAPVGATGGLPASVTPRQTLENLTRDLRRISRIIRVQSGGIESILGHRLIASFEGGRRSQRALSAAAEIISHGTSSGESLAVALVTGRAITGTITWDNRPEYAITGWSVEHLEGLLRVARSGTLLLSKSTHDELQEAFELAGVKPREHRSTVSTVPLYSLSSEIARQFSEPELSSTHEMTSAGETQMPVSSTLSGIGAGSVLANRFEILSEIGAGGMGVVYKARDRTLGELVALKMLKQDVWGDGERLERLKDELRIQRKISHPNVLRTFDFGDAEGFPFISMEYVRGITLKHLLDQSGRLPLSAGLRLARQLCRGLWAAHSQSVLHRDIKPENLIIEPNGNAKLMDFGIARPIQRSAPAQTQPGALIGTPFYLAPEQLEGQEPDQRADIYACGVVFYEIFTGSLPYPSSGNVMDIIQRKMNEEPRPPTEHWPTMPHTLEEIILRCLERDRNQRFPDVESLLKELEILRA